MKPPDQTGPPVSHDQVIAALAPLTGYAPADICGYLIVFQLGGGPPGSTGLPAPDRYGFLGPASPAEAMSWLADAVTWLAPMLAGTPGTHQIAGRLTAAVARLLAPCTPPPAPPSGPGPHRHRAGGNGGPGGGTW